METTVCPKCGATGIDASGACPKCGHIVKSSPEMESPDSRAVVWVGIGFVVLLVLWAVLFEPMMTRFNPFR